MSHAPAHCEDCSAYISRKHYAPFCDRGAFYKGIGCLKRNAPPQDHSGEPPTRPAPKKRGRRRS